MKLTLKVWRQANTKSKGSFETYQVDGISSEMSFLEMFDILNERLVLEGKDPIAFDHDCREGICGMCSMHINGRPHGPWHATTTCQLHMKVRLQKHFLAGFDRLVDRADQLQALATLQPVHELLAVVQDAVHDVLVVRLMAEAVDIRRIDGKFLDHVLVGRKLFDKAPVPDLVDGEARDLGELSIASVTCLEG